MVDTFDPSTLKLSDGAVKKIHSLSDPDKVQEINLRVYVTGGGCSGFQYIWGLSSEIDEEYTEIDNILLLDRMAEMYVLGSEIDYVQEIMGSFLKINNPLTKSSCGCGESFSV